MNDKFELLIMGQQFKRLYEKCYDQLMNEYDLKKIDIDVLYFLSHSGEHDTARDISNFIYVSKAHVSKSIESLHTKHLIDLVLDSSDRRYVHIKITEKGQPVVNQVALIKEKMNSILFRGISEEENKLMTKLVNKIVCNINDELERD